MFSLGAHKSKLPVPEKPELDLSGPRLRRAFENLVESAEGTGGVERYVWALTMKASLFEEVLGKGRVSEMAETEFCDLAAFIAPVRRRIGPWLEKNRFAILRHNLETLLDGWSDVSTADTRLKAFISAFPEDREHRWVRDLGAEVLHFISPERYPLMTRWIWDARVGSGVLREIWFADDVDTAEIDVDDSYATHLMLRGELEGFLRENGVFRDCNFYIDVLCAHIYAGYINDRGGQYLRADFCGDHVDGMLHTRRMLGLDAIDTETGRTRLKLIDGQAHVLGEQRRLSS